MSDAALNCGGSSEAWTRQKVRIADATPSHDQHLTLRASPWPIEGKLTIEMTNANAGHQEIRLEPEDVSDLTAWLLAWQGDSWRDYDHGFRDGYQSALRERSADHG